MVTSVEMPVRNPRLQWYQNKDHLGLVLSTHRVSDLKIETLDSHQIAFSFTDLNEDQDENRFAALLDYNNCELDIESENCYRSFKSGRDHLIEFKKKVPGVVDASPFGNDLECDFSRTLYFDDENNNNFDDYDQQAGGFGGMGDMSNFDMAEFQARMAEMQKNGTMPSMPGMEGFNADADDDDDIPDFEDDDDNDNDDNKNDEKDGNNDKDKSDNENSTKSEEIA